MSNDTALKRGPIPIYYQIMQIIRSKILSGHYPPESRLPTDDDFVKEFKVSRQTVRLALQNLVNEGMIERHAGRGSFVRAGPSARIWTVRSVDDLANEPIEGKREILSADFVQAGEHPEAAMVFDAHQHSKLFLIQIRRYVAGKSQSLSNVFIPPEFADKIPGHLFSEKIISQLISEYCCVTPYRMQISFSAELADYKAADLLDLRPGEALVVFERAVFSQENEPIQFIRSLYRPDRRPQRVELYARPERQERDSALDPQANDGPDSRPIGI